MPELEEKQKRFCDEYLKHLNATHAYMEAYGVTNKDVARANGARLLAKAHVKAYLAPRAKKAAAKAEISQEKVLKEIGRIAFGDIRKIYDDNGSLIPMNKLDDATAACISGVEIDALGVKKYKMNSKIKGLELLGRYHKLFVDRMELSGPDEGPIEISKLTDEEATKLYMDRIKKTP